MECILYFNINFCDYKTFVVLVLLFFWGFRGQDLEEKVLEIV